MNQASPRFDLPLLVSRLERQENGCLWYLGPLDRDGYGMITRPGYASCRAHRAYYEMMIGPIPSGYQLDHLCHNEDAQCPGGKRCLHRRCVEPLHLEPVTTKENLLRSPHTQASINGTKTHCINGHPFDEANTYWDRNGTKRVCRTCCRERMRGYRAARRRRAG